MTELERKHLVETDRHIAECKAHIAKQRELIERAIQRGRSTEVAETTLEALEESLRAFERQRRLLLDRVKERAMTTTGKNLAKYLREFDQIFDAEDMQILSASFDKAWEAVQASGVIYPKDKVELVRAILAKHIIAAAKDGERDHSRLSDGALLALTQSNLRRAQ